jgi:hypothetical protein
LNGIASTHARGEWGGGGEEGEQIGTELLCQPAALLLGFPPLALSSPLLQPPLAAVLLLLHLHHLFEPVLLLLQPLLPPPPPPRRTLLTGR